MHHRACIIYCYASEGGDGRRADNTRGDDSDDVPLLLLDVLRTRRVDAADGGRAMKPLPVP